MKLFSVLVLFALVLACSAAASVEHIGTDADVAPENDVVRMTENEPVDVDFNEDLPEEEHMADEDAEEEEHPVESLRGYCTYGYCKYKKCCKGYYCYKGYCKKKSYYKKCSKYYCGYGKKCCHGYYCSYKKKRCYKY